MTPFIPHFLHEPGVYALDDMEEPEVQHSRRKFLILLHFCIIFVLQLIVLFVQVINQVMVDFLVELYWRLTLHILDLIQLKKVDSFPSNVINQLNSEPDIVNAGGSIHDIVMIVLIDFPSNYARHGGQIPLPF